MAKSDNGITAENFERAVFEKRYEVEGVTEIRSIINSLFPNILNEENTGRSYKNSNGDLVINNKIIELKRITTDGSGTYLNTSMIKLVKYGCLPFKPFQEKHGVFDLLETKFDSSVRDRLSPIGLTEVGVFYQKNKDFCEKVAKLDKLARKDYVAYLYEYFLNNKENLYNFLNDCLTKNISNKEAPDVIIVYNSNKKEAFFILKDEILNRDLGGFRIASGGLGLVFNNLRINIGWQNRNGLCNPTIRVFLT